MSTNEQTQLYPVLALRGLAVFPKQTVHFDVGRDKSVKALEEAMKRDQKILLSPQFDLEIEDPGYEDLAAIGTVGQIKQVLRAPGENTRVLVEGLFRANLKDLTRTSPYLEGHVEAISEVEPVGSAREKALCRRAINVYSDYLTLVDHPSQSLLLRLMASQDCGYVADTIAQNSGIEFSDKAEMLELLDPQLRLEWCIHALLEEIQVLKLEDEIQDKTRAEMDQQQRDYYLREQIKVMQDELGDGDDASEIDSYEKDILALKLPEDTEKKLLKDVDRLKKQPFGSSEGAVLRGYLDTVLELPWNVTTKERVDVAAAKRILDKDHFGMEKVKERILETLAVRKMAPEMPPQILCLVGPPGTGKTSIARSVAEAMNKKYVRICLGGVRDEAEIRGHRKTYVGAMPGRITVALKEAGVSNPLMLLDEIDKTSSDYKGDTSAALLEVLDPEQNSKFNDHYVEIPQDLSEVLFIATANDVQGIPRPLLDRMELMEIPGYTENEKEHIAREHLIPKQMEINGIPEGKLVIQPAALGKLINNYTKEAGVRSLERNIGRICRKTARALMEEGKDKVVVTSRNISKFLGKERYNYLMANEKDEIGIARGLAWTQVGGDTLQIEVNIMPGKGELLLTGQLGDVMKESAQAGISYIRSVADQYKIDPEFFQKHDMHVHIPEGAVPKDGPSAGITMATAMLSAIIEKPVRADLAMTGEITLRGRVLPIGGLKEKLLAAKYAKIKEVLVPEKNRPDIEEMDKEIIQGLNIQFVDNMKEVLGEALA